MTRPTGSIPNLVRSAAEVYAAKGVTASAAESLAGSADLFQPVETTRPEAPAAVVWLDAALTAPGAHPLTGAVGAAVTELPWLPAFRGTEADFCGDYAFCEIVGPDAPCRSEVVRFGLFLQTPDTDYPAHNHAAIEDYYVLSGNAAWQRGDAPYAPVPPGRRIRHDSFEWHAMETFAEPLLAMWLWTGDIDISTYRMLPGNPSP
jgi:hypothetical protein